MNIKKLITFVILAMILMLKCTPTPALAIESTWSTKKNFKFKTPCILTLPNGIVIHTDNVYRITIEKKLVELYTLDNVYEVEFKTSEAAAMFVQWVLFRPDCK